MTKSRVRLTTRDEIYFEHFRVEGSLSAKKLSELTGVEVTIVHNRLRALTSAGFLEIDNSPRIDYAKHYKLVKKEDLGVRVKVGDEKISFNKFLESCFESDPEVSKEWINVYNIVSALATAAISILDDGVVIPQKPLTDARVQMKNSRMIFASFIAMIDSLLESEELWNSKFLVDGIIENTDYPLPTKRIEEMALSIRERIN